eukprot:m.180876 g.180876  ORF g.180876 m.180876 type:complete len:51 (+) comp14657_c0_seq5:3012-3164(+)
MDYVDNCDVTARHWHSTSMSNRKSCNANIIVLNPTTWTNNGNATTKEAYT